jgi:hypothetical protein
MCQALEVNWRNERFNDSIILCAIRPSVLRATRAILLWKAQPSPLKCQGAHPSFPPFLVVPTAFLMCFDLDTCVSCVKNYTYSIVIDNNQQQVACRSYSTRHISITTLYCVLNNQMKCSLSYFSRRQW